ncbi:MAG: Adenosylmethionine-8-amino-7-oxononanoate aminotransferase [Bacteroidota bacterium]|jgi:adenosylmethionine-8-amino-7-oxononanoate aminotransferase
MTLSQRDQLHNWHPYTQHKTSLPAVAIVKGEGALLWDEHGKEYIDAIASWWVNPYGHSNRYLADAIYKQLTTLEHVLFGGFTHEPAVVLSEKLMRILPSNQAKLFYSDNGSTAVEVAIKVALQYHYNQGQPKSKILAFENAFHGDTFAAMAASGISFFTEAFQGSLLEVVRVPLPTAGNEAQAMAIFEELVQTGEFAAFIFEPLVQGAAGMIMYEAAVLDNYLALCKKHQLLSIADEVMTGFGKTGRNFACDYLTQQPDMLCLSKALTGGTIPMSITTFTQALFDAFYSDDTSKALFHGHTFTANPTGCAAAIASLELLESAEIQQQIQQINLQQLAFQQRIAQHPRVKTTRVLGIIFALEIKTESDQSYYGALRNKLYAYFLNQGVILRPVGATIYILPPYVITPQQLQKIHQVIENALVEVLE